VSQTIDGKRFGRRFTGVGDSVATTGFAAALVRRDFVRVFSEVLDVFAIVTV
jgi:hypothetical protein